MRKNYQFSSIVFSTLFLIAFGNLCAKQQPEPPQVAAVEPSSAVTSPAAKVMVLGSGFSPDSLIYFGGIQARSVTFINPSALQVTTPYLRPGTYKVDLKSGEAVFHSPTVLTALAAPVDSTIDQANELAAQKQINGAVGILLDVAAGHPDYDVRAYARYRAAQLYLEQGEYHSAAEQAAWIWDPKVSIAPQTNWRYRLLEAEMAYSVSVSEDDHETDLRIADASIKMDVTENPEPRFWRALINARFGNMTQAKEDLKSVLLAEPKNASYRALAAYIGVLAGDNSQLEAFRGQQVNDARALRLLGQAAYIAGDQGAADKWWTGQPKAETVWAKLDYWAGRKHLKYGQIRVGTALVAECAALAADSREGKEAKEQLAILASAKF